MSCVAGTAVNSFVGRITLERSLTSAVSLTAVKIMHKETC